MCRLFSNYTRKTTAAVFAACDSMQRIAMPSLYPVCAHVVVIHIIQLFSFLPLFPCQPPLPITGPDHAARSFSNLTVKIITTSPIVTITNSANPNQPKIIAVDPTPLITLPFPKSRAICAAATDAVCCHSTET